MGWVRKWFSARQALRGLDLTDGERELVKTRLRESEAMWAAEAAAREAERARLDDLRARFAHLGRTPGAGARPVGLTLEEVKAKYRMAAKTTHPDKGGSDAAMVELNLWRAREFQRLGV